MIQKWHALEISILKAAESSEEAKVNYQLYFLITIFLNAYVSQIANTIKMLPIRVRFKSFFTVLGKIPL